MIVRTKVFDETVLAAGLDARPWRLPLPSSLHWVDVDLPGILNYKTETLKGTPTTCRYEAVTADLRDVEGRRALFSRLGAGSARTLVLSEGLLIYLQPEQVAALASDLHAQPSFQEWMIDLGSPQLLKRMKRMWGKNLEKGGAPFVFAPQEGTEFFRPYGWREKRFLSLWDEARRLDRRMKGARFWDLIGHLLPRKARENVRRFSGLVLLERA